MKAISLHIRLSTRTSDRGLRCSSIKYDASVMHFSFFFFLNDPPPPEFYPLPLPAPLPIPAPPPLLPRQRRLSPSVEPEFGGQLGPPGILLALQLPKIDGGGGQVGVVERGLHRLQRCLHPTQSPGVAVTQRVQWPLQRYPGQLRGLAQLLADVLAVHRLVSPGA